jgi:hypothetical protein
MAFLAWLLTQPQSMRDFLHALATTPGMLEAIQARLAAKRSADDGVDPSNPGAYDPNATASNVATGAPGSNNYGFTKDPTESLLHLVVVLSSIFVTGSSACLVFGGQFGAAGAIGGIAVGAAFAGIGAGAGATIGGIGGFIAGCAFGYGMDSVGQA